MTTFINPFCTAPSLMPLAEDTREPTIIEIGGCLTDEDERPCYSKEKHKKIKYWSATINHEVLIPAGSRVSVKAHTDRSKNELLLIVDGAVCGCLTRLR